MKVLKSTAAFLLSYSLFFAFTIALSFAEKDANISKNIREPAVAGSFYTNNAEELKKQVLDFLLKSPNLGLSERIKAILTPHAGYQFSGQIAALAYKQIASRKLDTVILLGPSHRAPFSTISVYAEGAFRTPLGLVEVDAEVAKKLIEQHKKIEYYPDAHIQEHSLEVQLPFIQMLAPKAKIVPIIMGGQNRKNVEILISALFKLFTETKDKEIFLVTTCDYSHYYPYQKAVEMDNVAMRGIEEMDYIKFLTLIEEGKCEMDAFGPVAVTMEVAKRLGADRAQVIKYANSGDVTGDKSRVVGYAAVAFFKNGILCCPIETQ